MRFVIPMRISKYGRYFQHTHKKKHFKSSAKKPVARNVCIHNFLAKRKQNKMKYITTIDV